MKALRASAARLIAVFARARRDADLASELESHLQLHVDDNLRSGMTPSEARRAALVRLGGVEQTKERVLDQRRLPWLETTMRDIRYALRSLRRQPTFTVVAVLTLALGIGATTAIFSVVDGVLLRPAPFANLPRLVMVWETDRASGTSREPASIPDFLDFRQRARQLDQLSALTPIEVNLTQRGRDPRRLAGLAVSRDLLPAVGVAPILGRPFTAEEDRAGGPAAVVISEDLWEELFARDPASLGTPLRLDDVEFQVVGVVPRGADFGMLQLLGSADYGRSFAERGGRPRVDVWLPFRPSPEARRENHPAFLIGRLSAGLDVAAAQAELEAIAADLERTYPSNRARGVFVEPLERVVFGPVRPALFVLLAAVALMLLVACANVANLLLLRAADRVREVMIRAALGASLGQLVRQFLAEAAVLTGAGVAFGVPLSFWALKGLVSLAPASLPRIDLVRIDGRVLAATLLLSVLVAMVFGLLPLVHLRRLDLQRALRGSGGGRTATGRESSRLRAALAVGELAMATMLIVGAGLLVRSLWMLQQVDPGFRAAGVLKAEFQLPTSRYPRNFATFPNWTERLRFAGELTTRLAEVPGVESVAVAGANPLDAGFTSSMRVVGREDEARGWPEPSIRIVGETYFGTVRVALLSGRRFAPADVATSPPVAIINEAAHRRYFGGRDAIGQLVSVFGPNRTIVGIVGNERFTGLAASAPPAVYLPMAQAPIVSAVLVRTSGDPAGLAGDVRRIVRDLDPQLPLYGVEPLTETLGNSQAQRRFTMIVLAAFSAVALLLATIGVHGVLAHAISQRTREIGIRVALGADAGQIRQMVLGQGAAIALAGIGVGLAGAFVLSRLLATLLYGVGARDPLTFVGVGGVLAAVAMVTCWLPARRAARVDPIDALRCD